jgi:cation:H+ antiporter
VETVLILLGSIALVFGAAVIFVNAIEWVGCQLRLGSSFVGAIIAPLFSSFPEMTVFLVAVFAYGGTAGEEIGIGTIFGQPFMASSLAYGLVGLAALLGYMLKKRKSAVLSVDRSLAVPYIFITVLFPLTLLPGLLGIAWIKNLCAFVFLGAFVSYIWMMYRRRKAELLEDPGTPYLCKVTSRLVRNDMAIAVVQLLGAVALLYFGSERLVGAVDVLARNTGMSPLGLALIVVPAATAIPETASALIWGYRGKDTLSLGSLVGEKILYSSLYPGLGLLLTSWVLDIHAYISVLATTVISLILLFYISKQKVPWYALCFGLLFFAGYAIMIFAFRI